MKYSELTGKTDSQLMEQLIQLRKEQMNLRFAKAAGQMEKPTRWREVRKDIARLHTAIKTASVKEGK